MKKVLIIEDDNVLAGNLAKNLADKESLEKTNAPKKRILTIEDDESLSLALRDNLVNEGYEVLQVKDGEAGLAMALREKPDLILLDILLPKIDGLTMLDKLRTDPWGKHVPVIILSNLSAPADVASAINNDVHQFLVKMEWKMEEVMQKVREELKQNSSAAS